MGWKREGGEDKILNPSHNETSQIVCYCYCNEVTEMNTDMQGQK